MSEAKAGASDAEREPGTEPQTVKVAISGGAATIELNRPQALNAWTRQFGAELLSAMSRLGEDRTVRAVMLTGAGRAFSSGADLKDLGSADRAADGRPDVHAMLAERYHPIIAAVRQMPKPVLAAVNGPAAGIGCSLALCCDLVVAAESAYFLLAFVNIGLAPDGGSSLLVPSRVGMARASQMAMLGERIHASQALEWGLINRVFPDDRLRPEADALLERLAGGPTRSYAASKRLLNNWLYARIEEQLELEARIQDELARSDDFVEGVSAFTEKRPARFSGA